MELHADYVTVFETARPESQAGKVAWHALENNKSNTCALAEVISGVVGGASWLCILVSLCPL